MWSTRAIDEDKGWRKSAWFNQVGADFMEHAFRFAHQADPNAKLLYNDYNTHVPGKTAFLVPILRGLSQTWSAHPWYRHAVPHRGSTIRIGSSSRTASRHMPTWVWRSMSPNWISTCCRHPTTGADVAAPREANTAALDPYKDGFPAQVELALAGRYEQFFRLMLKYRRNVKRITTWGLHDGMSWKNDFPVRGRTNYPLLFDRQLRPKLAYHRLMALAGTL